MNEFTPEERTLVVNVLRDYHDNLEDKYVGDANSCEEWEEQVKAQRKLLRDSILPKLGLKWEKTAV